MKSTMTFLFTSLAFLLLGQNNTTQTYTTKDGDIHLLGVSSKSDLQQVPYDEWYSKQYSKYELNTSILDRVDSNDLGNIHFKIFMGTWCGDSKKAVPEMYKVLEHLNIQEKKIALINVSAEDGEYKQSPTHEEKNLNIHRVPTFIVYKGNEELGRIVESPATSLEVDLVQILKGYPSTPNYKGVTYLDNLFEIESVDSIDAHLEKHVKKIRRLIKGNTSEINTYAYVLLDAEQLDKAIIAFKINSEIFSDKAKAWMNLGEAYNKDNQTDLSKKAYRQAIEVDDKDKYTMDILEVLMTML